VECMLIGKNVKDMTDVRQHKRQPRKDWSDDHWLQHAYIEYWSPWNSKEDKEYWYDMIKKLQK